MMFTLQDIHRIHLIGIGGAGLSAIARLLLESGYRVSGSDRQLSTLARGLQLAGAQVYEGHHPGNVSGVDLVIRSSAIPDDNCEVLAARQAGIPIFKRADFLGLWMEARYGIAVSGSHGKTTTTAMLSWVLSELNQDPSFIIGGVSINLRTNARAGKGSYFLIEADEYDRMFHGLKPKIAVVTNVEHDHPDCYPTAEDFYQAFQHFASLVPSDGCLIICNDDQGGVRLIAEARQRGQQVFSYGLLENADYQARRVTAVENGGFSFDIWRQGKKLGQVALQVPGLHNVRNALAVLAVIDALGLPVEPACRALAAYLGAGRRFEVRGEAGGVVVIDDYAHHPTEIRATLAAARARYPRRSLWAVWQPHTYSRTQALFGEFTQAFGDADHVLVTEVFASREQPPADGFSARQVVTAIEHPDVHFVPDLLRAAAFLLERLQSGDVLLVFSAGDADQISAQVLNALRER